jgi:hypothetical protein
MMTPKTSKSQVGADFCCGWGNLHICEGLRFINSLLIQIYFYLYNYMLIIENTECPVNKC